MTTKICGAGLGFLAFAVSLIIGLWTENPFITIVSRSLIVMCLFYILGCCLAGVGQKVIIENIEDEKKRIQQEATTENDSVEDSETQTANNNQEVPNETVPVS